MNNELNEKFLRMSDLANTPARSEKISVDNNGKKHTCKARVAKTGITGFSAKHIYHLIKNGKFPTPVKIGRASLWRVSEINAWFNQQGDKGL